MLMGRAKAAHFEQGLLSPGSTFPGVAWIVVTASATACHVGFPRLQHTHQA